MVRKMKHIYENGLHCVKLHFYFDSKSPTFTATGIGSQI